MGTELLLEIGTEEIPARFIPPALAEMAASFKKLMDQERIGLGEVSAWGTPRRLALVARGLAGTQGELLAETVGPPKAKAFDASGNPTPAAQGFAKNQGVKVEELIEVDTPKGVYLAVSKRTAGRPTRERLQELLPSFILGLSFPKSMRWGAETITFARPIHWILARLGGEVVPFTIGDVTSGGATRGHRFLAPQAVEVKDEKSYIEALKKAQVLVDPAARRAHLEQELQEAAARAGGEVVPNPGLLEENTFLVEYPSVVCGSFEDKFLALPDEVLITSMREHQRYFSLRGKDGKLLPNFIAVNNTLTRDPDVVRQGHERVIRARLSDAMFFFQADTKVPQEKRVEDLKGVMFHSLLGTSYEKMERFRDLAVFLAGKLAPEVAEPVRRAATLCKSDLVSEMVGEFPMLQGVMGREYARLAGEPQEVSEAIFTHYLPRHAGDSLPADMTGAVLGLADRLDTICGCFGVGLIPTGTADPYALRRHALAVIHILRDKGLHLHLPEAIGAALALLKSKINRTPEETALDVLDFFQTRLQHLLLSEELDHDSVAAVLAAGGDDVVDAANKAKALEEVRQSPDFPALAAAFKRVINISKDAKDLEVDEGLFEYPEERVLYELFVLAEEKVAAAMKGRDYPAACQTLAGMKAAVDAFFDKVLVMAKDERVRRNRLALLGRISRTFLQIADFSRITT